MRVRTAVWTASIAAWIVVGVLVQACGDDAPRTPSTGEVAMREWKAFYRPPTDRVPHELATNPGTPWGPWVGSRACKECHEGEYAKWRDSFHSRTLYDATEKTVFGDFSGKTGLMGSAYEYDVMPGTKDGQMYMHVGRNIAGTLPADTYGAGLPPDPLGTYKILYAFGNRRHQPYVVRAKDGRHWVPPIFWDEVKTSWQWDGWRPYVTQCGRCHVTGIRTSPVPVAGSRYMPYTYDTDPREGPPPKDRYYGRFNVAPEQEGWADGSVGCENCHGPGKSHVDTVRRMGTEPYRAHLAAGGEPTIYDPAKDTAERRMQQCDACHSFNSESPVSWFPGPKGYARDPHRDRIRPRGAGVAGNLGDKGNFYDDGSDMSPCTAGWALRDSKMGKKGVECRDCHDPHGNAHWAELTEPVEGNVLCLKCHQADASGHFRDRKAIAEHTRHPIDGPGSLCFECHMPRTKRFSNGVHVMSFKLPGHEFSVPTGRESDKGGPPASCNVCHTDRDAAWTRAVLDAWKRGVPPPK